MIPWRSIDRAHRERRAGMPKDEERSGTPVHDLQPERFHAPLGLGEFDDAHRVVRMRPDEGKPPENFAPAAGAGKPGEPDAAVSGDIIADTPGGMFFADLRSRVGPVFLLCKANHAR